MVQTIAKRPLYERLTHTHGDAIRQMLLADRSINAIALKIKVDAATVKRAIHFDGTLSAEYAAMVERNNAMTERNRAMRERIKAANAAKRLERERAKAERAAIVRVVKPMKPVKIVALCEQKSAPSLCWRCARATLGTAKDQCLTWCSWAALSTPVEGWDAVQTKLRSSGYEYQSYNVRDCPLFAQDRPRRRAQA